MSFEGKEGGSIFKTLDDWTHEWGILEWGAFWASIGIGVFFLARHIRSRHKEERVFAAWVALDTGLQEGVDRSGRR